MNGLDSAALADAYRGRKVFVTGHTGFKGGWLTAWLSALGAEVVGYALPPEGQPCLHDAIDVPRWCRSVHADVRDRERIEREIAVAAPDVVFHLAAQPLVRRSYQEPIGTLETNVMGTAFVLEGVRKAKRPCAVVVITSDKCYANQGSTYGYREDERLGGHDPYSSSKAAAELVVETYRRSYFAPDRLQEHGVRLASARAGNVIGGGDWATDRIVPDSIRALTAARPIVVRNPRSVRPWQHVLEPLGGYLLLGARLAAATPGTAAQLCDAWNFGPRVRDARPVGELASGLVAAWGSGSWEERPDPGAPHEAALLRLSIEKAERELGWTPRWPFEVAVSRTVEWYRAHSAGAAPDALAALTLRQIQAYQAMES